MRGMFLIVLGALLVTAQVAVAQELGPGRPPAEVRQADPAARVQQPVQASADADSGLHGPIGGLPFTGIDLIVISGAALVMTGIGFAHQRSSAPRLPPRA